MFTGVGTALTRPTGPRPRSGASVIAPTETWPRTLAVIGHSTRPRRAGLARLRLGPATFTGPRTIERARRPCVGTVATPGGVTPTSHTVGPGRAGSPGTRPSSWRGPATSGRAGPILIPTRSLGAGAGGTWRRHRAYRLLPHPVPNDRPDGTQRGSATNAKSPAPMAAGLSSQNPAATYSPRGSRPKYHRRRWA